MPIPLADLPLPPDDAPLPRDVRAFLREADRRIERFHTDRSVPAFVASDFTRAYGALKAVASDYVAPGNLFCEWGSGFGVVTCLAAMLEFEAYGIEIDPELVDEARQLADDFGLSAEFVCGSFVPRGGESLLAAADEYSWFTPESGSTAEEMGLDADDFAVVYAYPWPDEEGAVERLFERYAAAGAILVSYHGGEKVRLRRKIAAKRRRR
jgi:hypothetical protein